MRGKSKERKKINEPRGSDTTDWIVFGPSWKHRSIKATLSLFLPVRRNRSLTSVRRSGINQKTQSV
jgi:hypothetical protein